ncbi:MAG TPA: DsbC family protein [Gammaproteobacteria bacterium]|nr:DsbC family protein [Gammaproteobacteria bacterium]
MLLALLLSPGVYAGVDQDRETIRKALHGLDVQSVEPTPIAGLYEVVIGTQVIYISADGRYVVQGDLVDYRARRSLTEERRAALRRKIIDGLDESKMIVYKPRKVKHVVTVFTDIDCGYCRKLHRDIQGYLDRGIEVRYLFFPRAGAHSASYDKAVSVWCASDRKKALTDSKNDRPVPKKTCDNPIDEHMELARQLGLRGTPYILLENGMSPPGYVPPRQLAHMLDQMQP